MSKLSQSTLRKSLNPVTVKIRSSSTTQSY